MSKTALEITGRRVLGEGVFAENDTRKTGLNNNDLIIGSSGAGKTGGYVIPNIADCEGSFICADTKGSLCAKLSPILEKKGYKVYTVDFVAPEKSCVYNPLDYIRKNAATGEYRQQDVQRVVEALLPDNLDSGETFWVTSARIVLECLIMYVMEAFVPEERTLGTVIEVYKVFSAVSAEKRKVSFLDEWALLNPESPAVSAFKMFKGNMAAEKMWGSINGFVTTALKCFDLREAKQMFNGKPAFRIEDLGREKCAVFLNISDTDRSMDKLVNIFYTQALQALCAEADANAPEYRLRVPTRIFLDDFAANAVIPDFDKIISVIRSREIYVSIILQSLSQLNAMYGRDCAATIINNCDHIIYLGANDLETAEFLAEKACRTPESVLSMPLDKEYLISRGEKARLINKVKPYSVQTAV